MPEIILETLEKGPDSNVRFCLDIAGDAGSQGGHSDLSPKDPVWRLGCVMRIGGSPQVTSSGSFSTATTIQNQVTEITNDDPPES